MDKNRNLLDYLQFNSFLSKQHKLFYIATPKVACTTLKWWFARLEGYHNKISESIDSNETSPDLVIHDMFHKIAPSVTGLDDEALNLPINSEDYFRFAVVRNPYKRIFSAWQSKILLREPLQVRPYTTCEFFHLPISTHDDILIAFERFLEHLVLNEAPKYLDVHWTPQADLLVPDQVDYTCLSQIENVNELKTALKKHLGSDYFDPFIKRSNESLFPYLPEFITPKSAEFIRLLYHNDFKTFSYSLTPPDSKETFSEAQFKIAVKAIGLIRGRHQRLTDIRSNHYRNIDQINQKVSEQNQLLTTKKKQVIECREQIRLLYQQAEVNWQQIADLRQLLSERSDQVSQLQAQNDSINNEYNVIINSKSWLITKPLRSFRRSLSNQSLWTIRSRLSSIGSNCWQYLPLSNPTRQKLKSHLFRSLPFLFGWTESYRIWKSFDVKDSLDDDSHAGNFEPNQNDEERDPYVSLLNAAPLHNAPVKVICFYLPQFHTIPENDCWWGKGFTEWTNVKPAKPQFKGHYQPHIPGELGYYNLLNKDVQHRQVELAKLYGIEGFCFYFYWFGGKRLLEAPLINYLNDPKLDLPFCLCWANENWSRRWDGRDSEVLIAQQHSPEDDLAFIKHVSAYLKDPRYIRIHGNPLLIVYRPSLLPSAKETVKRWRQWCLKNGIGNIYIAYTQSFENVDPDKYGFDAAIEFPPNNSAPPDITNSVTPMDKKFSCTIYDWRIFVKRSEQYDQPGYTLFRGVCPAWDNTARRKNHGTVFLNTNPVLYMHWLNNAIKDTKKHRPPDERLIFINAWNEWAEGTHLEPDERYGYAWLQATRNALEGKTENNSFKTRKIIIVAHDAHPHGAQFLALNLARTLSQDFGYDVDLVCLGDGPLKREYAKWATLHDLTGEEPRGKSAQEVAQRLHDAGHRSALVNTTVSGYFLETLVNQGIQCVALIHELKGVLEQLNLHGQVNAIAAFADKIVFPAIEVADDFKEIAAIDQSKIIIRPQGLYKRRPPHLDNDDDRKRLRRKYGLSEESQIILGVGYADYRKGVDLFVDAGLALAQRLPEARWIWIGHWEHNMQVAVNKKLAQFPELKDRFIFPGRQTDTHLFYGGADLFALTSREDPFPSVVLESFDAKLPVVGFDGAGGFINLLKDGCGKLVANMDAESLADAVFDLLKKPEIRIKLGERGADLVSERFSFRHYIFDLLDFLGLRLQRVSAIVPSYNYAHYLPNRLTSILKQNYPLYEIIFIDDDSTDNSVAVAQDILSSHSVDYRIAVNKKNSGSVFLQWKKGVELAKGKLVWIAEADDIAERGFLDAMIKGFEKENVQLSYTQSKQIDQTGQLIARDYLPYVKDVSPVKWLNSYYNCGTKEIIEGLSVKNTIPNVSAVVFRREPLEEILTQQLGKISSYRVAGDWFIYVNILKKGNLYFDCRALNRHRRHNQSVTIQRFEISELKEIARMQNYIAEEFQIPLEYTKKAKNYLDSLIEQFSLRKRFTEQEIRNAISF